MAGPLAVMSHLIIPAGESEVILRFIPFGPRGLYNVTIQFRSLCGDTVAIQERYQSVIRNAILSNPLDITNLYDIDIVPAEGGLPTRVSVCAIATVLDPFAQQGVRTNRLTIRRNVSVVPAVVGEGQLQVLGWRGVQSLDFSGRHFAANNRLLPHLCTLFPCLEECIFSGNPTQTFGDGEKTALSLPTNCKVRIRSCFSVSAKPYYPSLAGLCKLEVVARDDSRVGDVVDLLCGLFHREDNEHVMTDLSISMSTRSYTEIFTDFCPAAEEKTQADYNAILDSLPGNFTIRSVDFNYGASGAGERSKRRRLCLGKEKGRRSCALNRWKRLQYHIERRAALNNAGLRRFMTDGAKIEALAAISSSCDATFTLMTVFGFHSLTMEEPPTPDGDTVFDVPFSLRNDRYGKRELLKLERRLIPDAETVHPSITG